MLREQLEYHFSVFFLPPVLRRLAHRQDRRQVGLVSWVPIFPRQRTGHRPSPSNLSLQVSYPFYLPTKSAYPHLTHSCTLRCSQSPNFSRRLSLTTLPHPRQQPLYLSLSHGNPTGLSVCLFVPLDSMLLMGRADCHVLNPAEMQDAF